MKYVTMRNQQETLKEIGWLIGIIDGEGYLGITVAKEKRLKVPSEMAKPELSITNTDEEIVLRAKRILDNLGITCYIGVCKYYKNHYGNNSKNVYKVRTCRVKSILKLLLIIGSDLTGNKKERAKLVLEFCKSRSDSYEQGKRHPYSERELELIDLCQSLQKKGSPETLRGAQLQKSKIRKMQEEKRKKIHQQMMISVNCSSCGKQKKIYPSQMKRDGKITKNFFCDLTCRQKFQFKHNDKYQASHGKELWVN